MAFFSFVWGLWIYMEERKIDHSIEERVRLSLLYDFYGALLKESQRRMFEASVLEDFNLSEIADEEGITRQGVHDAIKRASRQLYQYEEKLGLAERFEKQQELVRKLHGIIGELDIKGEDAKLQEVFAILDEILREE